MRLCALLLPLLAAACQNQDGLANNAVPGTTATAPGEPPAAPSATPTAAIQTSTLTGLYESPGAAGRRSQMCMVDRGTGSTRFGIVVWVGNESCSGDGSAVRQGDLLRLNMAGDEPCTIDARIEGGHVTFPAALPPGCAYYCSRAGRFAGAAFDKTGGTAQDAMRAEDLVGDRLCAGAG